MLYPLPQNLLDWKKDSITVILHIPLLWVQHLSPVKFRQTVLKNQHCALPPATYKSEFIIILLARHEVAENAARWLSNCINLIKREAN